MNSVVKTTLLKLKMSSVAVQGEKLPYVDDSGHKRGEVSGFVFYNSIDHVWNEPSFRELIKKNCEENKQRCGKERHSTD